jgi:hypothetical protein
VTVSAHPVLSAQVVGQPPIGDSRAYTGNGMADAGSGGSSLGEGAGGVRAGTRDSWSGSVEIGAGRRRWR